MFFYKELRYDEVDSIKTDMVRDLIEQASRELRINKPSIIWMRQCDLMEATFKYTKSVFGCVNPSGRILLTADENLEKTGEILLHELFHMKQFQREEATRANAEEQALAFGKSAACLDVIQRYSRLAWRIKNSSIQIGR
jgi:hypothetical protein